MSLAPKVARAEQEIASLVRRAHGVGVGPGRTLWYWPCEPAVCKLVTKCFYPPFTVCAPAARVRSSGTSLLADIRA